MAAQFYTTATQATDHERVSYQLVLPQTIRAPLVLKAFVFYKHNKLRMNELVVGEVVDCHFTLFQNLKEHIEYVLSFYKEWCKDSVSLEVVYINIDTPMRLAMDQQELRVAPYKIRLLSSPSEIAWNDVRYFEPGKTIPHWAFELELLPGETPRRLLYKVNITGVTSPDSFYIRYPQPDDTIVGGSQRSSSVATPRDAMISTTDPFSASLTSSVQNIHVGESPRSSSVATPPDAMISTAMTSTTDPSSASLTSSAHNVQGADTRETTTEAMKETSNRGNSYMYGRESTIYECEQLSSLLRTGKNKRGYLTRHLSSKPHGIALVLGNEHFRHNSQRPFLNLTRREATEKDISNFAETFESLGYVVRTCRDYTTDEIKSEVIRIAEQYSEDYDSIVLCFSTHGENNEYIFGSDSVPLNVYELVSLIRECHVLKDKPIMMFIQCCRAKDQSASHNVDLSSLLDFPDSKPDLFIAWAASRLSPAYRSRENGSCFPAALHDVFIEHAHRHDLYTMMLVVKKKVHEEDFEQSPEIVDRLQYKVFFHPPKCC